MQTTADSNSPTTMDIGNNQASTKPDRVGPWPLATPPPKMCGLPVPGNDVPPVKRVSLLRLRRAAEAKRRMKFRAQPYSSEQRVRDPALRCKARGRKLPSFVERLEKGTLASESLKLLLQPMSDEEMAEWCAYNLEE